MRPYLIAACVALAVGVGAFSAGRFSAPLKVETREIERVVFQDRVVEKVVTVKAKAETKIVYRERVVTKDGTVTERESERTDTKTDTAKNADTVAAHDGASERSAVTITTLRPSWRVGVLVGAAYQQPLLPISGPLVVGALAEYRLVGGLWVGLWTLPQFGAVGAGVSFEF